MNETLAKSGMATQAPSQPPITCQLRRAETTGRQGLMPNMGEVELQNCSSAPVEIEYTMTPLQFLDLVVIGPSGTVVSEGHFSDRFSPMREPAELRLLPGEKFTSSVALLATVPRAHRQSGRYVIQASYRFQGIPIVAEPLIVELTDGS